MRSKYCYIYQQEAWPNFFWNGNDLSPLLIKVKSAQSYLLGKMETLGFELKKEATLKSVTQDIIKSSEIEGEILDLEQVRSSVAKRLGLNVGGGIHVARDVEGIVDMMLDATQQYQQKLTKKRLFNWHASLFQTGRSGLHKIVVGKYRKTPMKVVSGYAGKEKVHYEAPEAKSINKEMEKFLGWFNTKKEYDDLLAVAIAHLWFITIHPFEDGNGRIARTLSDMLLAKAENSSQRFYSMSAQIRKERKQYYDILEKTQRGSLDITGWLVWFLQCFLRAVQESENLLVNIYKKNSFWQKASIYPLNARQIKVLNMLLKDFKGNLTSSKWAKICKCSQDSANRDINELVDKGLLRKLGGGRSIHYTVVCGE